MATSQSHTLGEFLRTFFENLMKEPVREFAAANGLYFDCFGERKARKGKKVTWTDIHGSKHDLDFVLEKGGTDNAVGEPVAFIELAWRRYTKHSKNKVQEISGAVNPICQRYEATNPFKGAILSGQFTENSLNQLKNDDFHVLYIPFDKFVQAFRKHGLDVYFDESTSEMELERKYAEVSKESNRPILDDVCADLLKSCRDEIRQFVSELSFACNRRIKSVSLLPLHGTRVEIPDIDDAISYVAGYSGLPEGHRLEYIEVTVKYSNDSVIQCQFMEKREVIDFLNRIR